MITGERMAAVDENAAALGVARKQLMESSGHAVGKRIRELANPGDEIVIVAGRGNNGGDAFVAVRFLDDFDVRTILLGRPATITTTIARENWEVLVTIDSNVQSVTDSAEFDLPPADVVVDAMVGTGISGELREPLATATQSINESNATIISVDIPSGFDAETGDHTASTVEADHVITFHDTKPGLDDLDATVTVADIGIPAAAERFVGPGDVRRARPDARTGRAFVIGGGPYTGAPALAAQAALRTGMELSFVAAPEQVGGDIQTFAEDLIVQPYEGTHLKPDHVAGLVETAERYDDVVILGPGLGTAEETLEATETFLETFTGPTVVDADALSVVPSVDTNATLVCTPNRRELARMGGPDVDDLSERIDDVEAFAADLGHVVLAKGKIDVITDGERTRCCRRGTPGMAVGGTGDTLAGIVAALLEYTNPFEAASVGAYVNGVAGERLADNCGQGFLASELLSIIPRVLWGER